MTHVALKDHNSFLIATDSQGLKVFEKGILVFSGELPEGDIQIFDAIYIPALNSYLLASRSELYRKDINVKRPYLYLSVECSSRYGSYFRYSKLQERLIVNQNTCYISVINPVTRKTEIVIQKGVRWDINDFRLFGENEDRVVSVNLEGHIVLYSLNYAQKRGVVSVYQEKLMKVRYEELRSTSVCQKNQYVCVEVGTTIRPFYSSRMIILKICQEGLIKTASIDLLNHRIGRKWALESIGYAGIHILWVGLSWKNNGFLQVFDFNSETDELREIEQKRENHQENWPVKLHRLDDKFYYTGLEGKLMSLRLSK